MKIDADLRMAINAAARAQKPPTSKEERESEDKAVADFLKKHRTLRAKAVALKKQSLKARALSDTADAKLNEFLRHYGLVFDEIRCPKNDRLEIGYGDSARAAFLNLGGTLPAPSRRKWTADEVVARLATAKPDQRDAILKEYGINWS